MNKEKCKSIIYNLKNTGAVFTIKDGYLATIPFNYSVLMPECVELLSKWRIENPSLSPTRFPVSNNRTEKWINSSILQNDYRVMFMIQNSTHQNIGHIGLSEFDFINSTVRIDSVLRGVKDDSPGIMHTSIHFIMNWCKYTFESKKIDLVVLSDNDRAIDLYLSSGFIKERYIPLRRVDTDNETSWVEDETIENPEKFFLHMECEL